MTVLASRSIPVTSPSSTVALRCETSSARVGGATSPSDKVPVAAWHSRGLKQVSVVFATIVTAAGACRSAFVPNNPPNPEPITTTRWGVAGRPVDVDAVRSSADLRSVILFLPSPS